MKKIIITIESNDNDVSNKVFALLKEHAFNSHYELEIKPEYPFKYQEPLGKPFFADSPIYCMVFHYHFDEFTTQDQLAQFRELESFAKAYGIHVKQVMKESRLFTERLEETENASSMMYSKLGPQLKMEAMKSKLTTEQSVTSNYFSTLFQSSEKPSSGFFATKETSKSKLPYYFCGVGLAIAVCAIGASTGFAIVLGCISALLFAGGLYSAYKQGYFGCENYSCCVKN